MDGLAPPLASLLRVAGRVVAAGGPNGSLLILMYHRVLAKPDPLLPREPDAALFSAQVAVIRQVFNVLTLAEAVARLRNGSLPPRAACITFDDGYANNLEVAAPILTRAGLKATFFVATGFIGGGRMFNDTVIEAVRRAPAELDLHALGLGTHGCGSDTERGRTIDVLLDRLKYLEPTERLERVEQIAEQIKSPLPGDLMMSVEQLRRLSALGMEIGAHTVSHPILTSIGVDRARTEIDRSRSELEEIVAQPVTSFAYPNGRPGRDYGPEHVQIVRELGFECAVSTGWGVARTDADRFQLPRIAPWDRTALRYALRMLHAYTQASPRAN